MITTGEQASLSIMADSNCLKAVVHETDSKNGAVSQMHNSFSNFTYGWSKRVYTGTTSYYKNSTLTTQQSSQFDLASSNLISSTMTGAKPITLLYGYGSSQVVAKVTNATRSTSYNNQPLGQSAYIYIPPSSYVTQTTVFKSDYAGTIAVAIQGGSFLGPPSTILLSYSLTGPTNQYGYLCMSSVTGYTCSYPATASFANMPAGTYTLTIQPSTNSATSSSIPINFTYTGTQIIPSVTSEFFYEGFEESNPRIMGNAHTGNGYYDATSTPYAVNFALLNGRTYVIQWWNWANSKWIMNEQTYTGPMTIPGIIDDIRIFPSDAQMTTFSYTPMVGKTGETDPSGRSASYEYDGLGRINVVRDNDRNIVSKNCYNYAGQAVNCPVNPVFTNTVQNRYFQRNNCAQGYLGSIVNYSVNAGVYSSYISQADADQQAQNYISLNGQAYANSNGTCTLQTWYNTVQSGNFTRNNCGTGYTGSTVTYTVPANTYSSNISQADADGKATQDIQNNGQNYANANGTCTQNCGFAAVSGWQILTSNISSTGSTVNFTIVLHPTTTISYWYSSFNVATITGGCKPSSTRSFYMTDSYTSSSWYVTVYPSGQVYIQLSSGSAPSGYYIVLNLTSGGTFNL
jgi:YD repeat-containing protein